MEEKQSTFKLSGREKAGLIWHYLRPCWGHFAAALLCACLSMALNALTPQIIRITVDSILGSEEAKLPALLLRVLPLETLRQEPVTALWWAAGAVMVTALLRGLCSFGQRAQLSRGSEAYVKGLRDDLYRHIQAPPSGAPGGAFPVVLFWTPFDHPSGGIPCFPAVICCFSFIACWL